jgi:WD40 repeat protein/energy-coupling factor transporter ATP-binding protein EcfA2
MKYDPDSNPAPPGDSHSTATTPAVSAGERSVAAGRDITGVVITGDVAGDITIGYTKDQVSALLAQITATLTPKPFDGRCPYLGLDAFQEEDADRFFGREKLVAELVTRVKDSRFIVIAGPSGSGKSSLVRAGLIHALKQGALPDSNRWLYESLKPGRRPLEELARVTASLAGSLEAGNNIRTQGMNDATILHQWAEIALKDRRERRAVIFVDQFEEIFTQVSKEDERVAFLNLLTHAATVENGRVTVLFTMRSDFVANCATYPRLNALLNERFLQVGAMQPDELVSAIARPALQVGLRIDPDLIAQIMNDMQNEPGALPLMQFALKDLFDAQQAKGNLIALTLTDYLARGGLRQALERHADAEFATLDATEQQLARAIFSGLIEIGRGREDTRRTALFDELIPTQADEASVATVVRKLADARLVTVDVRVQVRETRTVTLAHERLIDAWPWLRKLVDENRDAIALQNQIAEDAREWEQHGRDASYLYAGARLATAREKLAARKLTLSELAQSFIDAGIATEEAARRRRQRLTQILVGGLATIALVFALLAWLAFSAQQLAVAEQKLSRSRELAALAINQINDFPERALLIALEANRNPNVTQTFESENALRQTLLAWRGRAVLQNHTNIVNSAQFSCDGQWIVTASDDGTARVWNFATAQETLQIRGHAGAVNFAQFSCDNRFIVTAGADKTARVWDAKTGTQKFVLQGHTASVKRVRFSGDSQSIVTASDDGTARVWNAETGIELKKLTRTSNVNDAQFSSDGTSVIVAVSDNRGYLWWWNSVDANNVVEFAGAQGVVYGAAISSDKKFNATVSADRSVRIYRADDPLRVPRILNGHTDIALSVQFSPDNRFLLTTSRDQTARVWDIASGKEIVRLVGHADQVSDAVYSPDGRFIVTASSDRTAIIWDAGIGRAEDDLRGHTDAVTSAHFSPDGERVVTASSDNSARIWNVESGVTLFTLGGHTGTINNARFSPNGEFVVTSSTDNTARIWNTTTGQMLNTLKHSNWVWSGEFSPDNKFVVTASDDGASVWDVATGARLITVLERKPVSIARFAPDGNRFLTVEADGTVVVWEKLTGKSMANWRGHSGTINAAQFSPDGKRIVTAGDDQTVRVWDVANAKELVVYRGHTNRVLTARFSHDGKLVVSGGVDQTARVWNAESGQDRAVMQGHLRSVNDASFSPDDRRIVTASDDATVRLWDAVNGKESTILYGHADRVYRAEFSPDGARVVTASQDGSARIHDLSIEAVIAQAQKRILRQPPSLTCDERRQYLRESLTCPTATPAPTRRP